MTDSQETQANESTDSQTIRIEMPSNVFDNIFKTMLGFSDFEAGKSSCSVMPQDACCPQAGDGKNQKFTFVTKRKG